MVCVLDFGTGGPGSSPRWGHCCWSRHITLTVPLFTLVGTGEFNAGGNPEMD